MKALIRIPTKDYAYIEAEVEGTSEQLVAQHDELYRVAHGGFGLDTKAWNALLDKYLKKGGMEADSFAELSKEQAWMIHELDKANARINK